MKHLLLERKPSSETATEAFLTLPGAGVLATIEQDWLPCDAHPGGTPFQSCVGPGTYELIPHTRPDGAEVLAWVNHDLGVYYLEDEMPPEGGRFLILFHVANWAHNVVGCAGPGLYHNDSNQGRMVSSSGKAMRRLMNYIDGDDATLEVRWI